ncbi:hypothetical protein T4E_5765 [Trichinella pseudospiralis]|uniref:Uncharacterized protein n=1 Tax=Trichinella pseudospiralis TaxID=6337 RepID=A0A0V0XUS5_TRIPS|nr:hypothetical protein T4E_5765 [Trichinella pseudospiralis]
MSTDRSQASSGPTKKERQWATVDRCWTVSSWMSRVGWDKLLPNKRIKIGFYPLCNLLVDDEVDGASRLCRKATSRKCHRVGAIKLAIVL